MQVNYSRYALQGLTWSEEHGKVFSKAESIITGLPGKAQAAQRLYLGLPLAALEPVVHAQLQADACT